MSRMADEAIFEVDDGLSMLTVDDVLLCCFRVNWLIAVFCFFVVLQTHSIWQL